jgi:hypothetical protein
VRNGKSAGSAECRYVFDERPGAFERILPLEVSCSETMVILKIPSDEEFVVIGRLSEIDSHRFRLCGVGPNPGGSTRR